jgi:hypothetical protein
MSCYDNQSNKKEIELFLTKLNVLLRESKFQIDFRYGILHHEIKGFCGPVEDDGVTLTLVEDSTGVTLYETNGA